MQIHHFAIEIHRKIKIRIWITKICERLNLVCKRVHLLCKRVNLTWLNNKCFLRLHFCDSSSPSKSRCRRIDDCFPWAHNRWRAYCRRSNGVCSWGPYLFSKYSNVDHFRDRQLCTFEHIPESDKKRKVLILIISAVWSEVKKTRKPLDSECCPRNESCMGRVEFVRRTRPGRDSRRANSAHRWDKNRNDDIRTEWRTLRCSGDLRTAQGQTRWGEKIVFY